MSRQWIPNQRLVQIDEEEFDRIKGQRLAFIIEDHANCGRPFHVTISDKNYVDNLPNDIVDWIEEHLGLVSFESLGGSVIISFETSQNAMLFKLMWVGI